MIQSKFQCNYLYKNWRRAAKQEITWNGETDKSKFQICAIFCTISGPIDSIKLISIIRIPKTVYPFAFNLIGKIVYVNLGFRLKCHNKFSSNFLYNVEFPKWNSKSSSKLIGRMNSMEKVLRPLYKLHSVIFQLSSIQCPSV